MRRRSVGKRKTVTSATCRIRKIELRRDREGGVLLQAQIARGLRLSIGVEDGGDTIIYEERHSATRGHHGLAAGLRPRPRYDELDRSVIIDVGRQRRGLSKRVVVDLRAILDDY